MALKSTKTISSESGGEGGGGGRHDYQVRHDGKVLQFSVNHSAVIAFISPVKSKSEAFTFAQVPDLMLEKPRLARARIRTGSNPYIKKTKWSFDSFLEIVNTPAEYIVKKDILK
jgi:hypothetical protein